MDLTTVVEPPTALNFTQALITSAAFLLFVWLCSKYLPGRMSTDRILFEAMTGTEPKSYLLRPKIVGLAAHDILALLIRRAITRPRLAPAPVIHL